MISGYIIRVNHIGEFPQNQKIRQTSRQIVQETALSELVTPQEPHEIQNAFFILILFC
jgi:hypothetical protein